MKNTNTVLIVLLFSMGMGYVLYQNSVPQQVTVIRSPGWGGMYRNPWGGRGYGRRRGGGHHGGHHGGHPHPHKKLALVAK